jgi:uncharacterized DUF497 family protein
MMRFEWDPEKNRRILLKHGVSFEEAALAFHDPLMVSFPERIMDGEERWQPFGMVNGKMLTMVAHTLRHQTEHGALIEVVRIISARSATSRERRMYETGEL